MKRLIVLGLAAALALTGLGSSAAQSPPRSAATAAPQRDDKGLATLPTSPTWTDMPTAEQMSNYYPRLAWLLSLGSRVFLTCQATAVGTLDHCAVDEEHPAGIGFGAAALQLAAYFHLKPKVVNGVAVDGAPVRFCIDFRMPTSEGTASLSLGPAPSPRSLELGQEIATLTMPSAQAYAQQVLGQVEASMNDAAGDNANWRTPQAQAATQAYQEALEAAYPSLVDQAALVYAKTYSEAELADLLAFFRSASGRAWIDRAPLTGLAVQALDANIYKGIYADTRKRLCAKVAC